MRYFMFNKPRGCVTARCDPRHKTVMDYIKEEDKDGLFPIGRLDKDTEGFLILTDDGSLCNRINLPESNVTKTYRFYSKCHLEKEDMERLCSGVSIASIKDRLTASASATILGYKTMKDIADLLDEERIVRIKNTRMGERPVTHAQIIITEGKKHQVKKMIGAVGGYVLYLERVAIGGLSLDHTLKRGEYRSMTEDELAMIFVKT